MREGTAWVELGAHPHVVRCYNVVRTADGLEVYLVLELIAKEPGREDASLRVWLTPGRPLLLETALLFALQIARAMQHAVERIPGFVRRDLKPENVLVGADRLPGWPVNRLRVTDFGLAAVLQGQIETGDREPEIRNTEYAPRHTQLTRGIVGTPLYMASEQWRGQAVGVYTDVYALGCILYEMVGGQSAVAGRGVEALQRAHCAGELRPLPAGLPGEVRALLARCLALAPQERYGSWEALGAALASALQAVSGRPAPQPPAAGALSREEQVAAGWSYNAMGVGYMDIGKAEVAQGYLERALQAGRATGERALEGAALGNLGNAYADLGDARRAIGFYEQRLAIAPEIGDRRGEGTALGNLGIAYKNLGDARRAIGYYEQALAIRREIGDINGVATDSFNMALLYAQQGEPTRALPLAQEAARIWTQIGSPYAQRAQQLVAQLRGGR